MNDPWAEFTPAQSQAPAADPWSEFTQAQPTQPQSVGQAIANWLPTTWPVRAAKAALSAATLPSDVYAGRADLNTPEDFARAQNLAMMASPVPTATRSAAAGTQMTALAPTAAELKSSAKDAY